MSFILDRDSLEDEDIEEIRKTMKISKKDGMVGGLPIKLNCYKVIGDCVYLPLGIAGKYIDLEDGNPNSSISYYKPVIPKPKFAKELLTPETDPSGKKRDQTKVVKEIRRQLDKRYTALVACCTGFGKTTIGTYLMSEVWGRKGCLVLCHLQDVREQWRDSIMQNIRGMSVSLDPKKIITGRDAPDISILGITKFLNFLDKGVKFNHIGMIIIDEMHLCVEATFFNALLRVQPYYLIGMSGTPDRNDGLDKSFELYFGPKKEFIVRKEKKPFKVVKVITGYDVTVQPMIFKGRVCPNWAVLRDSIETNEKRHNFIVDMVKKHPKEKVLIVSYSQTQSTLLHDLLDEIYPGECVLNISGSKKIDKSKRIFVCGMKKSGIGLDIPGLDVMFLVSDTKDNRQIEGRMRDTNVLIYDFVDNYSTLESHFTKHREVWYKKRGATITEMYGPDYNPDNDKRIPKAKTKYDNAPPPRFLSRK